MGPVLFGSDSFGVPSHRLNSAIDEQRTESLGLFTAYEQASRFPDNAQRQPEKRNPLRFNVFGVDGTPASRTPRGRSTTVLRGAVVYAV